MKSAITALQARVAVAFDFAQRAEQAEAGVPASERGQGVGAQVALARRESPNRGSRLLGFAKALVMEMPRTLAALGSGQLNEWRATLLVKETACLSAEDRAAVDEELAPDTGTFEGKGDRAIVAAAKAAAYRRDPRSVAGRASRAAAERTVSLRPAPDTMTYLTALLPVAQGVAVYAALTRAADSARSSGDAGTRGQVMADTLVRAGHRHSGRVLGDQPGPRYDRPHSLSGRQRTSPAQGYGIVPAEWGRELLGLGPAGSSRLPVGPGWSAGASRATGGAPSMSGQAPSVRAQPDRMQESPGDRIDAGQEKAVQDPEFTVWLRRLYTAPGTGELLLPIPKPGSSRAGSGVSLRPGTIPAARPTATRPSGILTTWSRGTPDFAGKTNLSNAAGLCEACNHTKENPGWST
jgi:hypothetical protein